MRSKDQRIRRSLALAIVISALAAPVASAATAEQLFPGGSGSESQSQQPQDNPYSANAYPGTVNSIAPPESSPSPEDNPYSANAFTGTVNSIAPPESSPSPVSGPATVSGDGFDWGDAGIGATAMLALAAIAGGAAVVVGHRPRSGHTVA